MKKRYTAFLLTVCSLPVFAQGPQKIMPVYELFSSSTCPPCRPASEHLMPIFENHDDQIVPIVYRMSWPGTGDPYFTAEGNNRRNLYSTNNAPSLFVMAERVDINSVSNASVQARVDGAATAEMGMELRFMLDTVAQSVSIRARMEAQADINDGGQRLFVLINERETFRNSKTNGETEFHYVFKKMLPESTGEMIIGNFSSGDVIEYDTTYTFQGDYRLPNNATDEIDHETEHSVEEFSDLYVVMFMQSLVDKRFYQSAIGEFCKTEENFLRPWGTDPIVPLSVEEFNRGRSHVVYPNPANDLVTIEFSRATHVDEVSIYSLTGELVKRQLMGNETVRIDIETGSVAPGVYLLQMQKGQERLTERIVVR